MGKGPFWEISLVSTILVASLKCIRNAVNPGLWYSVLAFYLFSSCCLGILYAIQYLGGGLGFVVNKIIHSVNKVRHFFKHKSHEWDVEVIDAMSALVDGTCDYFTRPSAVLKYCINKLFSKTVCDKMAWYESITLTRIFVARPMQTIFADETMMHLHSCEMTKVSDLCAWIVGTESFLKYMMAKGVWILVALHIFSPFLSLAGSSLGTLFSEGASRLRSFAHKVLQKVSSLQEDASTNRKPPNRGERQCSKTTQ